MKRKSLIVGRIRFITVVGVIAAVTLLLVPTTGVIAVPPGDDIASKSQQAAPTASLSEAWDRAELAQRRDGRKRLPAAESHLRRCWLGVIQTSSPLGTDEE